MAEESLGLDLSCDPHGHSGPYDWFTKAVEYAGRLLDHEQAAWNTNLLSRGPNNEEFSESIKTFAKADEEILNRLESMECDYTEGHINSWEWRTGMFGILRAFVTGSADAIGQTLREQKWDGYIMRFNAFCRGDPRGRLRAASIRDMNAELMNAELQRWIESLPFEGESEELRCEQTNSLIQRRHAAEAAFRNNELTETQWKAAMLDVLSRGAPRKAF